MNIRATRVNAGFDINGDVELRLTVPRDYAEQIAEEIGKLTGLLDVEITKYYKHRSLKANALLWKCIGSMAEILETKNDAEEIYLELLERYGVQKFLVVRPEAADSMKQFFRIVHDMGEVTVNGEKGIQLRCIVGSSQYDTEQMSRLLRGTISECKEIGAFVPDEMDIGASIDLWAKERKTE